MLFHVHLMLNQKLQVIIDMFNLLNNLTYRLGITIDNILIILYLFLIKHKL